MQFSIVGYALLVLLICAVSLSWFANSYFHRNTQRDLQMLAEVLADNSRAAVTFDDAPSAVNILAAAKGNSHIRMAVIFKEGKVFAAYPAGIVPDSADKLLKLEGVWLDADHYDASVPIVVAKQVKGRLFLQSDLQAWEEVKGNLYKVFSGLFAGLLLLTGIVAYWLNMHITQPLSALSAWATQVSRAKDFNARAIKHNDDEVGTLVDSLNTMLTELAKQESIRSWNEILETEIRERKEVERDLIAMRNRAEAANKAKSQFLANMSHELRTPLNAIIGYSEMLQDEMSDEELDRVELASDVDKIRSAGKHLLSLINDILDLSKIEAGKMDLNIEPFNADELIQDVIGTITPLAESRGNQLCIKVEGEIGIICSDVTKIRQILFNLLSNAAKFTQQGQVELTCTRARDESGEQVVFSVHDSGIGISQDNLEVLFKPFSQADASTTRKYGGTGLGLAISRSYAKMLGGDIQVASVVGEGSTFTVRLPVQLESAGELFTELSAVAHEQSLLANISGSLEPTQLLLIDDDEAVHNILRHQLSRHGYEVHSAMSGTEGLKKASEEHFDVIVLDILMPEMDGWQVLQKLKAEPKTMNLPVVLYTIVADQEKGYALGADDYLVKPISKSKLLATLKNYRRSSQNRVLLIDDDQHTRELIEAYLTDMDFELITAENGREGLNLLQQEQGAMIILLDLIMPVMNGFEFIDEVRKHPEFAKIPIIVISAHDLSNTERNLLLQHTQAIIKKGEYGRQELIGHIEKILGNHLAARKRCGG
ncbi:MAG: response regulator [Pseudomonas sp.]|uniref:response regulator n=1 Tax=Pseudomonas sp. TaxID=306 RepID=UPI003BB7E284